MCEHDAIAMTNTADATHARAAIRVPRIGCVIAEGGMRVEVNRVGAFASMSMREDAPTSSCMSVNAQTNICTCIVGTNAITATHARADMSLIAGKPCSAATENRARSRLKRGGFATIEGLFYGNPGANFAAASILRDQLQLAFYTDRPSWNAAIAYRRVRLALIVMPFSFTSRSDHHVSTASIARRGADRRVVRDETGKSLPTPRVRHAVSKLPDEERAQDRRGPTEAF